MRATMVFATCIAILLLWLNIGMEILEMANYSIVSVLLTIILSLLISFVVAGIATILTRQGGRLR